MKIQTRYIPFLVMAILALLLALWAGLVRMGWGLRSLPGLSVAHGPLMVCGFLGVLISLERAVAIRQKWMFGIPAAAGLGWIALLLVPFLGGLLLTLASFGTFLILGIMVRRDPHLHTVTMFAGPYYDAALHGFFVGFVMSMIFGYAPIIFPAILGTPILYTPAFYAQLILLHASLILRLLGDLTSQQDIRRWGGLLNEVAILLFLGMTAGSIFKREKSETQKSAIQL